MVEASRLRPGMAVRYEGHLYKVLLAEYHPGQGKMGGVTHARFRDLDTGTQWEHSFRGDLRFEETSVERKPMEFLYSDVDTCYFMAPVTAEQVEVPVASVGEQARFLLPGMMAGIEFINDRPVSVALPEVLEIEIEDTAPPAHSSSQDNTWKPARLVNGVDVMVPQFIKPGDVVRIDLNTIRYMDRVKK